MTSGVVQFRIKKLLNLAETKLAESVEGLNSSLAQSPGKL